MHITIHNTTQQIIQREYLHNSGNVKQLFTITKKNTFKVESKVRYTRLYLYGISRPNSIVVMQRNIHLNYIQIQRFFVLFLLLLYIRC